MRELVLFTADWCKPCELIKSYIFDFQEKFNIRIVNVEKEPQMANRFLVRNLPTVVILENGFLVDTIVGALPKAKFEEKLKQRGLL